MRLSKTAQNVKPSPISDVFDHAVKLRAQGVDLVDFSVGEPDFDTPDHIAQAGIRAIEDGATRYTSVDGTPALKAAIARKFKRDQGLDFDPAQIVVGTGAKPVISTAIQAVVGAGDEVVLPTPCWPSHLGMIEVSGAMAKLVHCGANENFKITADSLRSAMTPKTRLLILCSPSNPTGAVYSADELAALAEVLRDATDVLILSDDLYEHIVYDDTKFATLASVAPDLSDRILTVNGVSKAYAMTGWRIGYAAGPKPWARAIAGLYSQTSGSPSALSQVAAIEALDGPQEFLEDWRQIYQRRRDLLLAELAQSPLLQSPTPQGAFYVFVGIHGTIRKTTPSKAIIENSADFAKYLMDNGVVVTPGSAFEADGFMRISIATSDAEIKRGARRIVEACSKLLAE